MTCTNGTFALWYTPKGTFASWHHSMLPNRHLHHDIHTWTFTSWHTHKGAFTSRHTYMNIYIMAYPQGGIYIMAYLHGHLHHDIPTRSIRIMTCPLEDILHLHLCKETFSSRVNMCAGTIMDKLCICTLAWDICIMKITSLKRDMCIINKWKSCICSFVKDH